MFVILFPSLWYSVDWKIPTTSFVWNRLQQQQREETEILALGLETTERSRGEEIKEAADETDEIQEEQRQEPLSFISF